MSPCNVLMVTTGVIIADEPNKIHLIIGMKAVDIPTLGIKWFS